MVGFQTGTATLKISVKNPQKSMNKTTTWLLLLLGIYTKDSTFYSTNTCLAMSFAGILWGITYQHKTLWERNNGHTLTCSSLTENEISNNKTNYNDKRTLWWKHYIFEERYCERREEIENYRISWFDRMS